MKVGIILLCRYESTRLPGKILLDIEGRPVIDYIIERIQRAAPNYPIVVATSDETSDLPIINHCHRSGIECFTGSLEDVSSRFLSCAEHYGWDQAVRINGDNLFLDCDSLREMLALARLDYFDFITNVPGRTFPYGMSIEIVKPVFLSEALRNIDQPEYREHVTLYLYDNPEIGRRYVFENKTCPEAAGLQLALDTFDDLVTAKRIISSANQDPSKLGLSDIYNFLNAPVLDSPWTGKSGPFLISEIGGNHEGDFEVAKEMARLAIECGSDSVKFQLYTGDSLVSPVESPARHQHFKKFELSKEQHIYLAQMCRDAGVSYSASVWDLEMLEWIDPFLDFYKIGSGDLTAWPILEAFAKKSKPLVVSTGLATISEVLQTVHFIQRVNPIYKNPNMLCLLQCTSMYPIPYEDANLNVMDTLSKLTGLSVGYSDHTVGMEALKVAVSKGATVLEYHFTDTREGKDFRDHKVSLTPSEVQELKSEIEKTTALLGSGVKHPQASELENEHEVSFRRAVYLNRSLQEGEVISESDLVYLRPAHGTDARDSVLVIGSTALRDLKPFTAIVNGIDYSK